LAVGSGELSFDPISRAARDTAGPPGNDLGLTGGPALPFAITQAAIPEPAGWVLGLTGVTVLIGFVRSRRRRS
jgi:hypothetical protein